MVSRTRRETTALRRIHKAVCSGELCWETMEAAAPRWVLVVDGPPGGARRRLAPQDPSTPQAATASQLRELIRRAFHAERGHWPISVSLAAVPYTQRFRFQVVTS